MPVSHGRAAHIGIARLSSSIRYHPPTHCLREIGITRVRRHGHRALILRPVRHYATLSCGPGQVLIHIRLLSKRLGRSSLIIASWPLIHGTRYRGERLCPKGVGAQRRAWGARSSTKGALIWARRSWHSLVETLRLAIWHSIGANWLGQILRRRSSLLSRLSNHAVRWLPIHAAI